MKKLITLLVLVVALGGAGWWYWRASAAPANNFRTAEVIKSRLVATIGATGTLEPEEVVDVGAQVQGRITDLGDPATKKMTNWGLAVEQGDLLAKIDPDVFDAQLKASEADLAKQKANKALVSAQVEQAEQDWIRAQGLYPKSMAKADFDAAKANLKVAQANLDVANALIRSSEAQLKLSKTNLSYTEIRAPVKGVIIDRRVNIGQTVVASLSAPSLFLIAKDLSKMEVWATVNEADVGKIYIGQPVTFTVDAYPGDTFYGKVKAQGDYPARLNATMNQNVVTYTVVVSADNVPTEKYPHGKLWPYLTANLSFIVKDQADTLLVPNAALRWQPSKRQIHPDARAEFAKMKSKKKANSEAEAQERGYVWVVDGDYVRPIQVVIGLSDGVHTEILPGGGDLPVGTQIVVGEGRTTASDDGGNPFAPKMPWGKKPSPKD